MSLGNILAHLYPEVRDAQRLCDEVGIDWARIDFSGSAVDFWWATLEEVDKQDKTVELLYEVSWEYPNNVEFLQQQAGYLRDMLKMSHNARVSLDAETDIDERLKSVEMQISIIASALIVLFVTTVFVFWV